MSACTFKLLDHYDPIYKKIFAECDDHITNKEEIMEKSNKPVVETSNKKEIPVMRALKVLFVYVVPALIGGYYGMRCAIDKPLFDLNIVCPNNHSMEYKDSKFIFDKNLGVSSFEVMNDKVKLNFNKKELQCSVTVNKGATENDVVNAICSDKKLLSEVKEKLGNIKEILDVYSVECKTLTDEQLIRKYLFGKDTIKNSTE